MTLRIKRAVGIALSIFLIGGGLLAFYLSFRHGFYEEAMTSPSGRIRIFVALIPLSLMIISGLLLLVGTRFAILPLLGLAVIQLAFGNNGDIWIWSLWSAFFVASIPVAWWLGTRRVGSV